MATFERHNCKICFTDNVLKHLKIYPVLKYSSFNKLCIHESMPVFLDSLCFVNFDQHAKYCMFHGFPLTSSQLLVHNTNIKTNNLIIVRSCLHVIQATLYFGSESIWHAIAYSKIW